MKHLSSRFFIFFVFGGVLAAGIIMLPAAHVHAQVATSTIVTNTSSTTITANDDYFSPQDITVSAGTTITWHNVGSMSHTVTADNGLFNSGTLIPDESFSYDFTTPGSYPYYCQFHGGPGGVGMSGVVTVVAATNASDTPPIASSNSVATSENTVLSGKVSGYDTNTPPLPLTYAIVNNPTEGTLTSFATSSGEFVYTPSTNFSGTDSFTFVVNNGVATSSAATESIMITPISTATSTATTTPITVTTTVTPPTTTEQIATTTLVAELQQATRELLVLDQELSAQNGSGTVGGTTAINEDLGVGASGAEVTALQQELQNLGYFTATPTGYFGSITQQAVEAFQTAKGISPTGYVGPLTLNALATS